MALKPALKERFTVVSLLPGDYPAMLEEIRGRIRAARYEKPEAAEEELIVLYGDIGRTISERCKDSGGVKSVLERLAADLQNEFPELRDFSVQHLWCMCQLYLTRDENPKLQPPVGEIARESVQKERLARTILEDLRAAEISELDRERRAALKLLHDHLAVYKPGKGWFIGDRYVGKNAICAKHFLAPGR